MFSLPSYPYQDRDFEGHWGPKTSNQNFCEEDYVITKYIAEFVNTLTNLVYVLYGVRGLRSVARKEGGGVFSSLAVPYWGLVGVGVLSGWYHCTLKYHSQMGDDLSMFLAVGTLMYQLLTFDATPTHRRNTALLVLGTIIPVSIYHCWTDEIYVHELAFGIMVIITGRKIRQLIKRRVQNEDARGRLRKLAWFGTGSGLFGYFLWNIDYHLCPRVTAAKRSVGLPWGLLLELHGWWHIFTGIGAYVGMALVEYLVTMEDGEGDGFMWPVRGVLRGLERDLGAGVVEGKGEGKKGR